MHGPITAHGGGSAGIVVDPAVVAKLSRFRRTTIVALTAGMHPTARAALVDAAFALRRAARGPSKLARRLRRKSQLGLAGAF